MDRRRFDELNQLLDKEIAIAKHRSFSFSDSRNLFLADIQKHDFRSPYCITPQASNPYSITSVSLKHQQPIRALHPSSQTQHPYGHNSTIPSRQNDPLHQENHSETIGGHRQSQHQTSRQQEQQSNIQYSPESLRGEEQHQPSFLVYSSLQNNSVGYQKPPQLTDEEQVSQCVLDASVNCLESSMASYQRHLQEQGFLTSQSKTFNQSRSQDNRHTDCLAFQKRLTPADLFVNGGEEEEEEKQLVDIEGDEAKHKTTNSEEFFHSAFKKEFEHIQLKISLLEEKLKGKSSPSSQQSQPTPTKTKKHKRCSSQHTSIAPPSKPTRQTLIQQPATRSTSSHNEGGKRRKNKKINDDNSSSNMYDSEISRLEKELTMWDCRREKQRLQLVHTTDANKKNAKALRAMKKETNHLLAEKQQQERHIACFQELFSHFEKSEVVREKQKTLIKSFQQEIKAATNSQKHLK